MAPSSTPKPSAVSPLSTSSHLTRQELLRRRLTNTQTLSRVYRHHFWALMDDLRAQHRNYYWTYGLSPFCEDAVVAPNVDTGNNRDAEGCIEGNGKKKLGRLGCAHSGCKLKAMALTSFCYLHILSDPNQKLYKPCSFVIKAPEQGQILCGKPILSSAVPSLCNVHLPKTIKEVKQALKKAGITTYSSGRLAPKFHVVVAEYVRLIQSKRRAAQKRNKKTVVIKEEYVN